MHKILILNNDLDIGGIQKSLIDFLNSKIILNFYSKWFDFGFNLIKYLPFFLIGMLFYLLFKNNNNDFKTTLFVKLSLSFFIVLQCILVKICTNAFFYWV